MKRLFNKCRSGKDPHSLDLYRGVQRNYLKEVKKASTDAWRAFCSSIDDLSSQLDCIGLRILLIKRGSLVAPSGKRTRTEGETFEFLLTTHFPDSGVTKESTALAADLRARRPDWRLATRVVTYRRVEWAIDNIAPYKNAGVNGIFPALLQQARGG
jgi:hypothetical protein